MNIVDALVVTLGLDATNFKAGQAQTTTSLKAIGEGATKTGQDVAKVAQTMVQGFSKVRTELLGLLGLFVAGKSIGGLTSEITHQDAALGRLSNRLGVSTNDLSAWEGAAQRAGARSGDATNDLTSMSAALEKFKLTGQGGDTFIPYLTRLGVHLRNANGEMKDTNEQQLEYARAFQEMDKRDPKATDFLAGQLPGMNQGMIDFLRRGPADVQNSLGRQQQMGTPSRQDAENAQAILGQVDDMGHRVKSFARHLLNDATPAITGLLTKLGAWLDSHLPGWEAAIKRNIKPITDWLQNYDWTGLLTRAEAFGKRAMEAFDRLTSWQPPHWLTYALGGNEPKPGEIADTPLGPIVSAPSPTGLTGDARLTGNAGYVPWDMPSEGHAGTTWQQLYGHLAPRWAGGDDTRTQGEWKQAATLLKPETAMIQADVEADKLHVPRDFARRIFAQEGGLNPDGSAKISRAGAIGAGQLMPDTARGLGVNPYDTAENVAGSVRYMAQLIAKFHGNQAAAAAAYNAGPNNAGVKQLATTGDTSGLPAETRRYIAGMPAAAPVSPAAPVAEVSARNYAERLALLREGLRRGAGVKQDAGDPAPALAETAAPPVRPASYAVPTAAQRWGSATVHHTEHHDNRSEMHVGPVTVHTQAKDAHGIARDIDGALRARNLAAQANRGLR